MSRTAIVTGAAGFIGHAVTLQLLDKGYRVFGIDNLNDYYDVQLKKYRLDQLSQKENFDFKKIDIENVNELEQLFSTLKIDVVYNLAARAGVRYSMKNPHVYMTTNAIGSLNLLEMVKKFNIKKYVLASTSSLYAGKTMPFSENLCVTEPISPYASSKLAAETMAYSFHYLYGIDITVVRYFTVYGPAGRPDMSQFRFMRWIDEEKELEVFGDGSQSRDFTFIEDIARGTVLAGEKPLGFEIINLGGGNNPTSINKMIEILESLLSKKAKIKTLPFNKSDMMATWANIDKAKKLLNWEPTTSIEAGLKACVDNYRKNYKLLKAVSLDI